MNKTKVLTVLSVLFIAPVLMFADVRQHLDRLEFGPVVGAGFFFSPSNPVASNESLVRVQMYDVMNLKKYGWDSNTKLGWPGIEAYGFQVGYRASARWQLQLKTVRQRMCYWEGDNTGMSNEVRALYYNAMWHVDAIAEFNLLKYGNTIVPGMGISNVVPYIGLGVGATMYNKDATLRAVHSSGLDEKEINGAFPAVGLKNDIAVGVYVPAVFGLKYRVNDNVQLVGSFQYNLYLTKNSNLAGGTCADDFSCSKEGVNESMRNRPTYEGLDVPSVGTNHNCLFSISAIFNLSKWYENRLDD